MYLNSPIALAMNITASIHSPYLDNQCGKLIDMMPTFIKIKTAAPANPIATIKHSKGPGLITFLPFSCVGMAVSSPHLPPSPQQICIPARAK